MQKGSRKKGTRHCKIKGLEVVSGLRICGLGFTHVFSLPRTFTTPLPHPDHGLPLSTADPASTPVPHGVLDGTPPVS